MIKGASAPPPPPPPPNEPQCVYCRCHGQVESNVRELMGNMVKTEQEEWKSQQPPECDVKGKYYTPVGINLFQIIDQNVRSSQYIHII